MLSNSKPYEKITKDELDFCEQIGRGAQGEVYKAFWEREKQFVAVKHVFEFDPELVVLNRIQHKHIVQFLGAVTDDEHFKAIVLEYAEHGSLYQVIQQDPPDFEQMLMWSRHIALGLNYLHNGVEPKIIHRDLKSKNVVIASAKRIAKICDFGSSRELNKTVTKFSRLHGTVAWMAPEVMRQSLVSEKCDTYSFGMLLWELITGKIPFHGEEDPQIMFGVCQRKRRPPIPEGCPEEFANLITKCWQDEPEKRPSIDDINKKIGKMLLNESLTEEVDDFLSSRQQWIEEFDRKIEDIRKEFESIELQWAKKLEEKENEIENLKKTRFLNTMAPEEKGVSGWKEIEVVQWINYNLPNINEDYSNNFFDNHITGNRLLNLTDIDLQKMGILPVGHRMDILHAITTLKNKILSLENFPPLMSLNTKQEKSTSKNPGIIFKLILTYGNNFYPGKSPKWNLFVYVEGDEIAVRSIKCVEFKISNKDILKINRTPFVMEGFRYEQPTGCVDCKLLFKGNIIKPKTWTRSFSVVCDPGGFNETCELEICLNEEYVPSTTHSLASSISSVSSYNVVDQWQTSGNPVKGAWLAGPPSIARSPGFTPHTMRRDSSPFSNISPNISPRLNRRKYPSGNGNHQIGLNRSKTSPAKMNQVVRSRSYDRDQKVEMQLSLQNTERKSSRMSDVTPTHDPRNPRFSSARNSLIEGQGFDSINIISSPNEGISFSSLSSTQINQNFASAQSTFVGSTYASEDGDMFRYPEQSSKQDPDVTPNRMSRLRGVSMSSTISASSSLKDTEKLDDFFEGLESGTVPISDNVDWSDKPTWVVSPKSTSLPRVPPPPGPAESAKITQPGTVSSLTKDRMNLLAREGKLTYADILKCPSDPAVPPPPASETPPQNPSLPRNRKNSTGSNTSEKTRGYRKRGSRGSQRGRGKPRGKSLTGSPRVSRHQR
ncbi:hypothetical protein ACHWQZ_G009495 [Mnemiopsis leidyi]